MKDSDKKGYTVKNIVLFTLNASYIHTSLALRCLADAIIEYRELDCRIIYRDRKTEGESGSSELQVKTDTAAIKQERSGLPVTVKMIERTISDSRDRVLSELYESRGDIFLFSCYIWNIESMMHQASDLKKLLPSSVILAGGPEISFRGYDFLKSHPYH